MTDDMSFTRRIGFAGLGAVGVAALMSREAIAQGAGGAMDRIISEKKFKIGYIASPPSTIKDPASGERKGYGVDAMRFICKTLNEREYREALVLKRCRSPKAQCGRCVAVELLSRKQTDDRRRKEG